MKISYSDIKGIFYLDPKCKQEAFIGGVEKDKYNNEIIIRVLNNEKNGGRFYNRTLYAIVNEETQKAVCYTFFNCQSYGILQEGIKISFSSFVKRYNYSKYHKNPKSNLKLILENQRFKKVSFGIRGFDKWLWENNFKINDDFYIKGMNKKGERACDKDSYKFELKNMQINKKIKLEDASGETITIEIKSSPSISNRCYPDIHISQYCVVSIIVKTPQEVDFFYYIINTLKTYFTILWNHECKIYDVHIFKAKEFRIEFFSNDMVIDSDCEDTSLWTELPYQTIKSKFPNSLKKFYEIRNKFIYLISFLADVDPQKYLDVAISEQIQAIEAYGNVISAGQNGTNNRADIASAINSIPDDWFTRLFIEYSQGNDRLGRKLFGSEAPSVGEKREYIAGNLSNIRNYLVHPYINGAPKDLSKDTYKISGNFIRDEDLDDNNLKILLDRLNKLLRYLFYKEIGLEAYYR